MLIPWKSKLVWLLVSIYSAIAIAGPGLHFLPGVPCCGGYCVAIRGKNLPSESESEIHCCEESCPFHKNSAKPAKTNLSEYSVVENSLHTDCSVCKLLATLSHSLLIQAQMEQLENASPTEFFGDVSIDPLAIGLFQSRGPPTSN